MKKEEIAQWVISNRYPKSELDKVSDLEMYNFIVDKITKLIGPEIDLDLLAVDNEKKNQRIKELEDFVKELHSYLNFHGFIEPGDSFHEKARKLLNQKP